MLLFKKLIILGIVAISNSIMVSGVPVDPNFNYCQGLKSGLNFYKAQRAGVVDPNSEYPWQHNMTTKFDTYSDGRMNSNGNGYLSGGYFDAGDYIKITFPLAFSMQTLAWTFIEFKDNIEKCGLTDHFKSTIKWGVDWLIAAHPEPEVIYGQCGQIGDHDNWERPSQIYDSERGKARNCNLFKVDSANPSVDIIFQMTAALAASSIVFESDKVYSNLCKTHSHQLWDFGIKHGEVIVSNVMYDTFHSIDDEKDWAATWMKFSNPGSTKFDGFKSSITNYILHSDWHKVYSWDRKHAANIIFHAKHFNMFQNEASNLIDSLKYVAKTNDGILFLDKFGNNRYALGFGLIEAIFKSSDPNRQVNIARTQMEIILGNNKKGLSYVSRLGFVGSISTVNIHHRAAHWPIDFNKFNPKDNTYLIEGALVGGPGSQDDSTYDRNNRDDHEQNEVALDFNSVFVGVMSSLINSKSTPVDPNSPSTSPSSTPSSTSSLTPYSTPSSTPYISSTPSTPSSSPNPTYESEDDIEDSFDSVDGPDGSNLLNSSNIIVIPIKLLLVVSVLLFSILYQQ